MKSINSIAGVLFKCFGQTKSAPPFPAPLEAPIDWQTKDALIYPFTEAPPLGTLVPLLRPPPRSLGEGELLRCPRDPQPLV